MAKFINTRKAVSELEEVIKNAGDKLILISPYLKLSKDLKELLKYRNGKDKITTVIFGKQELVADQLEFLQSLRFVILKYNENLHAKCYVNESKMIITSLNLYEFSMANNKEMGVLIDKNDSADSQLFEDAMREVDYIHETSEKFGTRTSERTTPSVATDKKVKTVAKKSGYCIRTGVEIPFNPEKPLSYDAYKKWMEYGNPEHAEKYCHFSGEVSNGETSVKRPILKKYWKKAKEIQVAGITF